jgi:uncharacterized protein DUF4166
MDRAQDSKGFGRERTDGLYPRLLGEAWNELSEPVRRIHGGAAAVRAAGWFDVRRGAGTLVSWICALLRLPAEGGGLPVRLVVSPHPRGERWDRTIGAKALITEQSERPGGLLAERFGPLELSFRLEAVDRALVFVQTGAALRLGPVRLPLPRFASPRVEACAWAAEGGRGMRVQVRLSVPLAGSLLTYEGPIDEEGSKP